MEFYFENVWRFLGLLCVIAVTGDALGKFALVRNYYETAEEASDSE